MNVYEAAMKRINFLFDEFDYVYVSFSGGKDSGVMLEMVAKVAQERQQRFGIFHMDYECQYAKTTGYVLATLERFRPVADIYHVCVPFKVKTCTSVTQSYWRPWGPSERALWVRSMPEGAMTAENFGFFKPTMWDYDFQFAFGDWLAAKRGKTCCCVGIRTEEALNRWRAVFSDRRKHLYKDKRWTNASRRCVAAYPVFDWKVEDIWAANAKFEWSYNALYDLYHLAGVPLRKMRVASPFLGEGAATLKLYRAIEPDTWGRLVGRVNGVNFTAMYGSTTAMGHLHTEKPKGTTWQGYMNFLLNFLPAEAKENYTSRLEAVLAGLNGSAESGVVEYLYKQMCSCIIKNDYQCKHLGLRAAEKAVQRRKQMKTKYENLL